MRFLTAGESHGKGLVTIIDNFPAGVKIDGDFIDGKLALRQSGYGRGARQKIETDKIEFLSGVRGGYTTGSPISFFLKNKDYENWKERMDNYKPFSEETKIHVPRPGHADFAGSLKYALDDIRNVLERSSARETASRVAVGAMCQALLKNFGIEFASAVIGIGGMGEINAPNRRRQLKTSENTKKAGDHVFKSNNLDLFDEIISANIHNSELRLPFPGLEKKIRLLIDEAKKQGDTVGGVFEVQVKNVPVGLGSYIQWDEKLDGHIAMSCMSIQAIKSVEIGAGVISSSIKGSDYQDSIFYNKAAGRYFRKTNNAGGIEGGMSNGEVIAVRCAMKPLPTLMKPYLNTVNLKTKKDEKAFPERSDICAVPAASIVGEAAVAYSIALFFLKKFGGDSLTEIKRNYDGYIRQISGAA